jgi:hypothetical protein
MVRPEYSPGSGQRILCGKKRLATNLAANRLSLGYDLRHEDIAQLFDLDGIGRNIAGHGPAIQSSGQ